MQIQLVNQQKIKRIVKKQIQSQVNQICTHLKLPPSTKISFVFCDNAFIIELNKQYFKKRTPTDVIAFPLNDEFDPDYLGEVVVCVEQAVIIAPEHGNSWKKELTLYLIHGILHLLGYDDQTPRKRATMHKKQQQILGKLYD